MFVEEVLEIKCNVGRVLIVVVVVVLLMEKLLLCAAATTARIFSWFEVAV